LKDLVIRTGTNKLVADLVNLDRVRSLLQSISDRRRFLARRQKAREAAQEHGTYIFIDFLSLPARHTDTSFYTSPARNSRGRRYPVHPVHPTPATREQPRHHLGETAIVVDRTRNSHAPRSVRPIGPRAHWWPRRCWASRLLALILKPVRERTTPRSSAERYERPLGGLGPPIHVRLPPCSCLHLHLGVGPASLLARLLISDSGGLSACPVRFWRVQTRAVPIPRFVVFVRGL
jgi:hypothetical protein